VSDKVADRLAANGSVSTIEDRGCGAWCARTGLLLTLAVMLLVGLLR